MNNRYLHIILSSLFIILIVLTFCTVCRRAIEPEYKTWSPGPYQTFNETSDKLINADFENTSRVCPFYDDEIVGWVIPSSSGKGELKLVGAPEVAPHSGSNCLSLGVILPMPDGNMRAIAQNVGRIPARKGDVFEISIWCKGAGSVSNSTPSGLSVYLNRSAKGDQWIGGQWCGKIYRIAPPSAWTLFKDKITIEGDNVESVRLSLDAWGTNLIYCDDVMLEKIEPK